ncbi:MAG: glycosyltransferase family 2 protein [Bacteroidetes bacterium]|nr:glycosyltransferase family 2 protein [Bacteroidota bacterium]
MDVSVIIVSFNNKELTRNCLNSLYEKTKGVDFDVIVVDNDSHDGSAAMIENEFPSVKLIQSGSNLGFGKANNLGIESSDANYVFLLNNDTILVNNAVKLLFDKMESSNYSKLACCGGALFNQDMTKQISFGRFPTLTALFFYYFLSKIFPDYYSKNLFMAGYVDDETPVIVDYVTGADMLIRKSVLDKCGNFDDDFFLYFEETELCSRFIKAGYRNMIFPEAKIIHLCGMSTMNIEREKIFNESLYIYLNKNKGKLYTTLYKLISSTFSKTGKLIKNLYK